MASGYEPQLSAHEAAALKLTDAIIGLPGELSDEDKQALLAHFEPQEILELSLSVGLFLGMSKVLIVLGLEPDEMETMITPTPGSPASPHSD